MFVAAATTSCPLRWREPEQLKPMAKFLQLMRESVAATPDRTDLKLHLAKALLHVGHTQEIVGWLKPAAADDDANPELLYCLGRAAMATADDTLACNALRSAAAKGFARAFGHLAATLIRLDQTDEALQVALRGLQCSPMDFDSLPVAARVLLGRGEAERLWALCLDLCSRGAWGGWLPAVMASAAATLGHEHDLSTLVDPARWFAATQLALSADFNQRLAAELLEHKSLSPLPAAKATTGAGMRVDRLELAAGPAAQDLLAGIREAVETYVAERQIFSDHPIMAHRPESVELRSWALTVHDDGHEAWHIHPFGWISGVYYVAVPKPGGGGHPGAIEFGLHPFGRDERSFSNPRWHTMPQAGQLLLFPSYYAHRTRPTGVGDLRVCVAFDIRPSEAVTDPPIAPRMA
jgi:uncharacterized protein (TIGR02466 family)